MWTTDDDSWQDVIASGCKKAAAEVGLNAVEVWELENRSGWFHPVHIHLVEDDNDPNDAMTAALPQWDG
jgi:FtsP/CotA-like multicopper oxidase with cupredoxin domain